MRKQPTARRSDLPALLILISMLFWTAVPVRAADPTTLAEQHLEVVINGQSTNLIVPFTRMRNGGLATTRAELGEVRLRVPGDGRPEQIIALSAMTGLKYKINEAKQQIEITVGDGLRERRIYDAHNGPSLPAAARSDYGAVLNYSLFASGTQSTKTLSDHAFSGSNASLDGRFVTPYGVINQTGIVGTTTNGTTSALRLETYGVRVDPETARTTRIGDTISGGVSWSRPIRMAGVQVQNNYTWRSDLVTASLPSFSGSAAVPSTVDVYVNNIRSYSQKVDAGPFDITNLPIMTGSGEARIVLRDASGREQETSFAFFNSPRLLRPGLFEASAEVGAPRLRYGIESDVYEASLVASGTLRRGVFDWLTLETHGEAGLGIATAGIGAVARAGSLGIVSAAISGSADKSKTGTRGYASIDTKVGPVRLHASSLRTFGDYADLASASAQLRPTLITSTSSGTARLALHTARSVDQVSIGIPNPWDDTALNASFLRLETDDLRVSRLFVLSYSRPLIADASLFATAFRDLDDKKGSSIFVGVHMPLGKTPLGKNTSATFNVVSNHDGTTYTGEIAKTLDQTVGSWGWRVRDSEGVQEVRDASVAHRTSFARIEGGVRQSQDNVSGRVQADGAIVAMGGGVFFSNRIDDSFGVVSAGAPGVTITHQNIRVGETNADGKLLLPGLRSYHANKISVDASNLPIDAEIDKTVIVATPAFRSGVYIDFDVKTSVAAALVILKMGDGHFVPAGAEATLGSSTSAKIVGYDGQVYLNDLGAQNKVSVKHPDGTACHVTFPYQHAAGQQSVVGPLVCQ